MSGGVGGEGRPCRLVDEVVAERVRGPVRIGGVDAGPAPAPVLRLGRVVVAARDIIPGTDLVSITILDQASDRLAGRVV
jgi:hypothetical protein